MLILYADYGTKRPQAEFGSVSYTNAIGGSMARDSEMDGMEPDRVTPVTGASKDRISDAVKQVYDTVANEPLPDKLSSLLEQLKSGDRK